MSLKYEPSSEQSERGQLFFDGELETMLKEFLTFIDGQLTDGEREVRLPIWIRI